MTDKLKPCPFCGNEGMIAATLDDQYRPMCRTDDCAALDGYNTRTEAITAWNTRAADALEPSGDVVERVARAIAIAMFGYDCIPHDTELCRASESRVGTVMRAAQAALGACHAE